MPYTDQSFSPVRRGPVRSTGVIPHQALVKILFCTCADWFGCFRDFGPRRCAPSGANCSWRGPFTSKKGHSFGIFCAFQVGLLQSHQTPLSSLAHKLHPFSQLGTRQTSKWHWRAWLLQSSLAQRGL